MVFPCIFQVHAVILPVQESWRRRTDVAATQIRLRIGGNHEGMVVTRKDVTTWDVATNGLLDLLVRKSRGHNEKDVGMVRDWLLLLQQTAFAAHRGCKRVQSRIHLRIRKMNTLFRELTVILLFDVCQRILELMGIQECTLISTTDGSICA